MFQYISDIHLEYLTYIPNITKTADNLFLLGDIGHPGTILYTAFLNQCSSKYKNVFLIYGNHENHSVLKGRHKNIETMTERLKYTSVFPKNIYFLNNSCVFYNKITQNVHLTIHDTDDINDFIKIIGSTLWTDNKHNITDNNYKHIYIEKDKLLDCYTQSILFNTSKNYILKEIDTHSTMKCILLSHYSTHKSCNETYIDNKDCNHITELFTKRNLLACINGHTHISINKVAIGTQIKLLANCYGYKNENQKLVQYNNNITYNPNHISNVSFYGIYAAKINYQSIFNYISNRPNKIIDVGPISETESSYIITRSDKDNCILYASDAFKQLTGYNDEIIGENCRFLQSRHKIVKCKFRFDCDDTLVYNIRENVKSRTESQYILRNYKKSGQMFINLLTIIPIVYNNIEYIIGLQSDITNYINNFDFKELIQFEYNICPRVLNDMFLKDDSNYENSIKNPSDYFYKSKYLFIMLDITGNIKHVNNSLLDIIGNIEHETNINTMLTTNIDFTQNGFVNSICKSEKGIFNFIWLINSNNKYAICQIYNITRINKDANIIYDLFQTEINDKISDAKILADKILAAAKILDDKILADKILADKILADKILADAKILADKILVGAKILADANAKILADANAKILADKILADANAKILADKILADAKILADKILADAKILADKILVGAKILADANAKILADKILADANSKILADKILVADKILADAKILAAKIYDDNVTLVDVGSNAIGID
jgi:PAS domain S-box-containing protein